MNSALRCVTRTPLLNEYFSTGEYLHDLNVKNFLGMNGLFALAYGDLTLDMHPSIGVLPPENLNKQSGTLIHSLKEFSNRMHKSYYRYCLVA